MKLKEKIITLAMLAWAFHPAYAFAQTTSTSGMPALDTLVKRGLGLVLWITIGVSGVMGVVVFCQGVMKMWDVDDARARKQGKAMMFWGVFLTISVLFVVACRDYLTNGQQLTPADLAGNP